MELQNIWQGSLVRLRAVEAEDWPLFAEWFADTAYDRYTDTTIFPFSQENVRSWTQEQASVKPWAADHQFRWVVETLDGTAVGSINTHSCDARMGTFQYGVAIRRAHWRRGYATEAVRLVLRFFFDELRYQKVNVAIYAFNEASLALHQRLGFREEGRLRRMLYTAGAFHDQVLLGLTREEFEQQAAGPMELLET